MGGSTGNAAAAGDRHWWWNQLKLCLLSMLLFL
jgi:hypothetical protein